MSTALPEVLADKRLHGKANYLDWLRAFRRTAKVRDVWTVIQGREIIHLEPTIDSYTFRIDSPVSAGTRSAVTDGSDPTSLGPIDPTMTLINF